MSPKGVSNNPSGRPVTTGIIRDIKSLALEEGPKAWARLVEMSHNCPDIKIRHAATKEILDRAYGKPAQAVELGGPGGTPLSVTVNLNLKSVG